MNIENFAKCNIELFEGFPDLKNNNRETLGVSN